ncbi:MAG: glycosyltransferase family 2 protein [Woeseia sp.]|nr:glycosyltransferase family 2 protein [Woeseia sp.]
MDRVPLVSIGMPVYNAEAFIEDALNSLLAQTFVDFELIISDNASTDGTREICERYAKSDSRISYFPLAENLGAIRNFNRVFELSNGKYFKWASHDDICAPTFLERCVEILEGDSRISWCHSQSLHIDEDGQPLGNEKSKPISYVTSGNRETEQGPAWSRDAPHVQERFQSILLGIGGVLDSYGLIRSDVIRQTPLYLPYFGSEKVFMAELALRGLYAEIPEILFFVRVHSEAAYNLRTNVQQRKFIDPNARRWFAFTRLKLLRGYLSAVLRADLAPVDRLRCLNSVVQYLFQTRKWKNILVSTFKGRGMVHDHT